MRRPPVANAWAALALVSLAATVLRVRFLHAGPDVDVDTYEHAVIARALLLEPLNLRLHWVWLPLWHLVGAVAALAQLDVTLQRWLSVAASAVAPLVLARLLREADRETPTPFLAGVFLALWPLQIFLGASGEPEAVFQLLTLLACLAWERRRPVAAGAALSLAALLRYEAWVLLPVFLGLWWRRGRAPREAWAWALPGAVVAAWLTVHRLAVGEWFWFVRENASYVRRAWFELGIDVRSTAAQHGASWYAWALPWESLRGALYLALPGAPWVLRRAPRSFSITGGVLLAFLTVVWLRRGNLGLPRHFIELVPLYAALVAGGVAAVASLAARLARRPAWAPWIAVTLAAAVVVRVADGPLRWQWRERVAVAARSYRAEARVAAVVRANVSGRSRVFCHVPIIEVFSRLPSERFVRWQPRDIHDFNLLVEAAQRGHTLVVAAPEEVTGLRRDLRVLHRDERFVVLRRDAPPVVTPWLLARPAAH